MLVTVATALNEGAGSERDGMESRASSLVLAGAVGLAGLCVGGPRAGALCAESSVFTVAALASVRC